LGHVVSKEEIVMDPKNTKTIIEWPTTKYVVDVRSFMWITDYYIRFIEGFSNLAYHITSFQKKGTKFEWSQKCQDSFEKLKWLLNTAPIFKLANPNKEFATCTLACKEGLGGVLVQEGHVISYESRKLKDHGNNYATHDLELEGIIHTLKFRDIT